MPVHDWSRVSDGTFHHFQTAWIPKLSVVLNSGLLPHGYYALAEKVSTGLVADILTVELRSAMKENFAEDEARGGTALATSSPKAAVMATLEPNIYAAKANHIVIRHSSNNRVVAILEIVSPGNKSSEKRFEIFVAKAIGAL